MEAVFISLTDHWKEISFIVGGVVYLHLRFATQSQMKESIQKNSYESALKQMETLDRKLDSFVTEKRFISEIGHLRQTTVSLQKGVDEIKDHLRTANNGVLLSSKKD